MNINLGLRLGGNTISKEGCTAMIYQIFYDQHSKQMIELSHPCIIPLGVKNAQKLGRIPRALYDDESEPNLSEHNTLCEWRVLYYIWKNFPSDWVGFTSWKHNRKRFLPETRQINSNWIHSVLKETPIFGFMVRPVHEVAIEGLEISNDMTLKKQFLQWSVVESVLGKQVNDTRKKPMGRFHTRPYWDFVMNTYKKLYCTDLNRELDWTALGNEKKLHTWCNAFIARWDYFDEYMTLFSPLVLEMLNFFGSHPVELELAYICERLIIIFNYLKYSKNEFI